MRVSSILFRNYKILKNCRLPLSRLTLIVGPNGCGKSTALHVFEKLKNWSHSPYESIASVGVEAEKPPVLVELDWEGGPKSTFISRFRPGTVDNEARYSNKLERPDASETHACLSSAQLYSLDPSKLGAPVALRPGMRLESDGSGLAGVIDQLRDLAPERFEQLNSEFTRWMPEFDRILFTTASQGVRALLLRTRQGHHPIPAQDLSQGTLLALALLTLAFLPAPPSIVCLEEPDRGIHPRLLREIRDALYRLSHPESVGEKRPPVQVIVTSHSPYMLDLYSEHPEEIVIAQRTDGQVSFSRLSDMPDLDAILAGSHLGDVWYSGILGGVPVAP